MNLPVPSGDGTDGSIFDAVPKPDRVSALGPAIDVASLARRCMGNLALATLLLEEFATSAGPRIDQLGELAASRAASQVAEMAHCLKGAASIIGADTVCSLAAKIELAGEAEDLEATVRELRREFDRCLTQIAEFRGAL